MSKWIEENNDHILEGHGAKFVVGVLYSKQLPSKWTIKQSPFLLDVRKKFATLGEAKEYCEQRYQELFGKLDEIIRLRADLAAVTAERDYVMAEGLFSADQIRILRAERDIAIAERDSAIEERDYVMAEGLFRDEQNEDLRKTVSKIWEQLGNPTYKELNGRTIHDLIDSVIYERNDIAARLREENERLREAFEKAANDMRPMLRSLISRNEAEEIVRRAARAALEGVTEPPR